MRPRQSNFGILLLFVLFLIPLAQAENPIVRLDKQAVEWIHEDLHTPRLEDAFEVLTEMGNPKLLLAGGALFGIYGNPSRETTGKLWVSALGSTGVTVYVLKRLIERDRPYPHPGEDPAFPSGHTALAFTSATVLGNEHPRWRVPLYLAASVVGFSRVYLGRHYPSDVLAGALLGIGVGYLVHRHRGYILRIQF